MLSVCSECIVRRPFVDLKLHVVFHSMAYRRHGVGVAIGCGVVLGDRMVVQASGRGQTDLWGLKNVSVPLSEE